MRSSVPFLLLTVILLGCGRPSPDELYRSARKAQLEGKFDKAEEKYKELLKLYPEDDLADDALIGIASMAAAREDSTGVFRVADELLRRYPGSPRRGEAWLLKAEVSGPGAREALLDTVYRMAVHMGSFKDSLEIAQELLRRFVDRFPESSLADDALFMLGQIAQNRARYDEAIARYQDLLKRYPDSEHAYKVQFMIGFIYSEDLHDYAMAREAFKKLLESYPDCDLAPSAEWMLENMGKPLESLDIFKEGGRK
ncbi:MAG TPA: tetratricopeptide repeat protein [Candidatus Latescibacteria bacterium]|nr:tetratricopeptide repeat protein [Candidatus Latescibacterota bacterium]